ncbi:hypothetical protein [Bradyrhizobium canariense]|nr:hypothetical protein [Bradyrhizobium canariense]
MLYVIDAIVPPRHDRPVRDDHARHLHPAGMIEGDQGQKSAEISRKN